MTKQIKITCETKENLPFNSLQDFQGDLKILSSQNLQKLKKSIVKYGITVPFFVWKNGKKNFILDGHQRTKAIEELITEGYEFPDVPIVFIKAKNKTEAKKKLLIITSRFGDFKQEGFDYFIDDFRDDLVDLMDNINLPIYIPDFLSKEESEITEVQGDIKEEFYDENTVIIKHKCPKCSYEW